MHEVLLSLLHFSADAGAALVGGLILTAILFWIDERVFPRPQLSGRWFVQTSIETTAKTSYKGMLLKREIFLWQDGNVVRGTSEKIYESSSTGKRQYESIHRSRGEVSGVTNRYFSLRNRVRLHVAERTGDRVSTSYFELVWPKEKFWTRLVGKEHRQIDANHMIQETRRGIFQSTAASSTGKCIFCRNRYDPSFNQDVRTEHSTTYGDIVQISAEAGLPEPQDD